MVEGIAKVRLVIEADLLIESKSEAMKHILDAVRKEVASYEPALIGPGCEVIDYQVLDFENEYPEED